MTVQTIRFRGLNLKQIYLRVWRFKPLDAVVMTV